jgi:hypothetical protein
MTMSLCPWRAPRVREMVRLCSNLLSRVVHSLLKTTCLIGKGYGKTQLTFSLQTRQGHLLPLFDKKIAAILARITNLK